MVEPLRSEPADRFYSLGTDQAWRGGGSLGRGTGSGDGGSLIGGGCLGAGCGGVPGGCGGSGTGPIIAGITAKSSGPMSFSDGIARPTTVPWVMFPRRRSHFPERPGAGQARRGQALLQTFTKRHKSCLDRYLGRPILDQGLWI